MKKNKIFENIKTKTFSLYSKNKKIFLCCVCLVVAAIFLLFSIIFSPKNKTNKSISKTEESGSVLSYASSIETKLEKMILGLDGIDKVSAMVMVDSTPTTKYLIETNTETKGTEENAVTTTSETVVFEKNGSITTPIVVTTILPKVTGVLIVTNKIDAMTKLAIINSISVVLNIDASCISLLQERWKQSYEIFIF